MRAREDQTKGGTLEIPEGYFVSSVNLDVEEPYCIIVKEDCQESERKISIPKALAYYLTTHHNGSQIFRGALLKQGRNSLRGKINDLLSYEPISVEEALPKLEKGKDKEDVFMWYKDGSFGVGYRRECDDGWLWCDMLNWDYSG